MKHFLTMAVMACSVVVPLMASAALTPIDTEAEAARMHLTHFAWVDVITPQDPTCETAQSGAPGAPKPVASADAGAVIVCLMPEAE